MDPIHWALILPLEASFVRKHSEGGVHKSAGERVRVCAPGYPSRLVTDKNGEMQIVSEFSGNFIWVKMSRH